jgi:hypothetical protein
MVPLDRGRRVVLGTSMEHWEHVLRRIRGGITSQERCLWGFRGTFGAIIRDFRNLMVPLDRARRVVLGTRMEHLEHVRRRIRGEITRIRCQLHLRENEAVWYKLLRIVF